MRYLVLMVLVLAGCSRHEPKTVGELLGKKRLAEMEREAKRRAGTDRPICAIGDERILQDVAKHIGKYYTINGRIDWIANGQVRMMNDRRQPIFQFYFSKIEDTDGLRDGAMMTISGRVDGTILVDRFTVVTLSDCWHSYVK